MIPYMLKVEKKKEKKYSIHSQTFPAILSRWDYKFTSLQEGVCVA